MDVIYKNNIKENEFLTPNETQKQPQVKLNYDNNKEYIIIMHDPDAVGGNRIHWMITNIRNNEINSGKIIFPYKGPEPPPQTGKHRYIFELYEQKSNIFPIKDRIFSIEKVREQYGINEPIKRLQFLAENKNKNKIFGGKRRNQKRIISLRVRKNRSIISGNKIIAKRITRRKKRRIHKY